MHFFSWLFPWGLILQAVALVHFIKRRPDGVWLWIIIFLGPLGALVYIGVEMVPDLGLLRLAFDAVGRRKRIRHLEAVVLENPSAGNYEELADLYLDDKKYRQGARVLRQGHLAARRPTGSDLPSRRRQGAPRRLRRRGPRSGVRDRARSEIRLPSRDCVSSRTPTRPRTSRRKPKRSSGRRREPRRCRRRI